MSLERRGRGERKIELCGKDYLTSSTYAEYLWKRLVGGGILSFFMRIYRKIRKYTVFTAVIRVVAAVISLLEKSAILLLIFSVFILVLPIALIPTFAATVVSVILYLKLHGTVNPWLSQAEEITVYITSERFFGRSNSRFQPFVRKNSVSLSEEEAEEGRAQSPLFVRCALAEASEYTHPVIVVCSDPFPVARWGGLNLLTVKCDYFFTLRRFYFNKKRVSYLVLD